MAIHLSELKSMQPNTNGANRDEVNKQIAQLEANSFLQQSMQQRTGNMTNVQKRVDYNAGRAATDPTYAASVAGWTTEDKNRGWRTETKTVHETRGDLARKEARAYEAPDPNKIEN